MLLGLGLGSGSGLVGEFVVAVQALRVGFAEEDGGFGEQAEVGDELWIWHVGFAAGWYWGTAVFRGRRRRFGG